MKKIILIILLLILFSFFGFIVYKFNIVNLQGVNKSDKENKLAYMGEYGKPENIFKKEEAWYIDAEGKGRYMENYIDAFNLLMDIGVGISNDDLNKIQIAEESFKMGVDNDGDGLSDEIEDSIGSDKDNRDTNGDGINDLQEILSGYAPNGDEYSYNSEFAEKYSGKIFLQVQNNGEAWYVSPENHKRYFLFRPKNTYDFMVRTGSNLVNNRLKVLADRELFRRFVSSYCHEQYNNYFYPWIHVFEEVGDYDYFYRSIVSVPGCEWFDNHEIYISKDVDYIFSYCEDIGIKVGYGRTDDEIKAIIEQHTRLNPSFPFELKFDDNDRLVFSSFQDVGPAYEIGVETPLDAIVYLWILKDVDARCGIVLNVDDFVQEDLGIDSKYLLDMN